MFKKTLLATTALTVLSAGIAFSEMKVSGTIEYNYVVANDEAVTVDHSKALAAEADIRFSGSGDLGAGGKYTATYLMKNAGTDGSQLDLTFGDTTIELGQDNSAGVEDVKAMLPYVNNRFADVVTLTGIMDVQDNTSATTSISLNQKVGSLGTLSATYNPNRSNTDGQNTDAASGTANALDSSVSASFKGSLGIPGLTVGVGIMNSDNEIAANDDRESRTIGANYNFGKFAVGYQRTENTAGDVAKNLSVETDIDQYGVSFAASDALSIGIFQIKQDRTIEGTASTPDLEANLLQIGYKFGAAKVSYDFLDVENANHLTTDMEAHKIKIGVAF